jgi:hypothetical protein
MHDVDTLRCQLERTLGFYQLQIKKFGKIREEERRLMISRGIRSPKIDNFKEIRPPKSLRNMLFHG